MRNRDDFNSTSAEDHKNEGFLKSVWHKITDHPAHRDTSASSTAKTSDDKSTATPKSKKDEGPLTDEKESKKASEGSS
jgi:molecular chaperone DnaJ